MSIKFRILFVLMATLGVFLTLQISEAFAGCGHYHRQASSLRHKLDNTTDPQQRAKLRNQLKRAIERGRACDSEQALREREQRRQKEREAELKRQRLIKKNKCRNERRAYEQAKARYNKCLRNPAKSLRGKCGSPPVWNSWNNNCN